MEQRCLYDALMRRVHARLAERKWQEFRNFAEVCSNHALSGVSFNGKVLAGDRRDAITDPSAMFDLPYFLKENSH